MSLRHCSVHRWPSWHSIGQLHPVCQEKLEYKRKQPEMRKKRKAETPRRDHGRQSDAARGGQSESGTGSRPCWGSTAEKETDKVERAAGRGGTVRTSEELCCTPRPDGRRKCTVAHSERKPRMHPFWTTWNSASTQGCDWTSLWCDGDCASINDGRNQMAQ